MGKHKNVGSHPVELTGGRMVGIGEEVDLTTEEEGDEHNKMYIDEGVFLSLEGSTRSTSKSKTSTDREE